MTSCPAGRRRSAAARSTARARCSGCACRRASIARCALEDRDALLPPLVRLGTPVRYVPGEATATFSFSYDGDVRTMSIEALGDTWQPGDVPELPSAPLGARRAARRAPTSRPRRSPRSRGGGRVSFDGQGLVRVPRARAAASSTTTSTATLLRHIWVLKLADEEAEVLGDPAALGVREVLVTHGSRGCDRLLRRARRGGAGAPGRRRPDRRGRRVRDRVRRRAQRGLRAGAAPPGARPPSSRRCCRDDRRSSPPSPASFAVDLETDEVEPWDGERRRLPPAPVAQPAARRRGGRRGLDRRRGRRREAAAPRLARRRLDLARVGPRPAAGPRGRDLRRRSRPRSSTRRATGSTSRATAASSGRALALELPEIEAVELRS